jgi:hypothetical protein
MTSRPRQWHLVLLLGAVLVASYTWPLLPRLDRIGRADSPDGQYGLWQATWVARAIVTDPLHVYDANIFYPHRSTLAFSEPSLLAGVMGVPAYVATKSPYATHNLAVLGYFLLSFVSAYALGRYVTGEGLPAVACGVAYAFSPFMFARTAQLPMLGTFGLPLCLLALHRFVDAPSLWTAAAIGGALCLQALSCGYYTVFAVLIVGLGMIYFGALDGRWRSAPYWRFGAAAAAISIALCLPVFWPHLQLVRAQGFSRPMSEAAQFSADWRAWFASSAWAHRWMLPLLGSWNEVLFPGFLPIGLGLWGASLGLREETTARARSVSVRALVGFYVLLAVVAGWSAFGPDGGLYQILYKTVPLFSFIRAAGRFGIVVTLCCAVLMSLSLARISRSGSRGRMIATALVVLLGVELFSGPRPMTPALPVSAVYRVLAEQPRGAVMEFPFFSRQLDLNARYVLMSTAHWQPIVNGFGAFWPADIQQLASETQSFPSPDALARVRAWGVRYVIVHTALFARYGLAEPSDVIRRAEALPGLTLIASDQNMRLYQVNP